MRWIIIAAILVYQRVAPRSLRERCIFRHSCSNFVLEGARQQGWLEAIRRLRQRIRACRPGYSRIDTSTKRYDGPILVRLIDGSVIDVDDLSERVKSEVNLMVASRANQRPLAG